jgi:hypothetical protein
MGVGSNDSADGDRPNCDQAYRRCGECHCLPP